MAQEPARCDACGRELDERPFDPYQIPVSVNPNPDEPKNFVERSLKQHNETLDKLSGQLDELLELVRAGGDDDGQLLDLLDLLRQYMRPRHGLCIDGHCAPAASTRKPSRSTSCSTSTGKSPAPWTSSSKPATGIRPYAETGSNSLPS